VATAAGWHEGGGVSAQGTVNPADLASAFRAQGSETVVSHLHYTSNAPVAALRCRVSTAGGAVSTESYSVLSELRSSGYRTTAPSLIGQDTLVLPIHDLFSTHKQRLDGSSTEVREDAPGAWAAGTDAHSSILLPATSAALESGEVAAVVATCSWGGSPAADARLVTRQPLLLVAPTLTPVWTGAASVAAGAAAVGRAIRAARASPASTRPGSPLVRSTLLNATEFEAGRPALGSGRLVGVSSMQV